MSENLGKISIDELETLINKSEEGVVEVRPDGSVHRLNIAELAAKNLRLAKQEVQLLNSHAKKLRDTLAKIVKELDELLPDKDWQP